LIAVIIVALIPSRAAAAGSLESQVRDTMLEARFSQHIRKHKPAFSNSVVYDVEFGGKRQRFRTKAEAIAYCMSQMPQDETGFQPPQLARL
jgi:hypothetical protein